MVNNDSKGQDSIGDLKAYADAYSTLNRERKSVSLMQGNKMMNYHKLRLHGEDHNFHIQ